MLGWKNSFSKGKKKVYKEVPWFFMMRIVLGLISPNLEKHDVEFLGTKVQAIVSFPGKNVCVCSNNNNVRKKKIVKWKDRVSCLLFFKIMTVGSLPTEKMLFIF